MKKDSTLDIEMTKNPLTTSSDTNRDMRSISTNSASSDASSISRITAPSVKTLSELLQETLDIRYEMDLEDWVRLNASKTVKGLQSHSKETFIDKDGVKRYADTWLPADYEDAIKDSKKSQTDKHLEFETTGCFEVPIDLKLKKFRKTEQQLKEEKSAKLNTGIVPSTKKEMVTIRFLADWKRLWEYFEADKADDIALHAPLLRIYLDFFFHERTMLLYSFTFLYMFILGLILQSINSEALSAASAAGFSLTYLQNSVQLLLYFFLRVLYKGFSYYEKTTEENENKEKEDKKEEKLQSKITGVSINHVVHWRGSLVKLFKSSYKEVVDIVFNKKRKNSGKEHPTFEKLLNISLRFLTRHNAISLEEINFNRLSYRIILLLIFYLTALYCIVMEMYLPIQATIYNCQPGATASAIAITPAFSEPTRMPTFSPSTHSTVTPTLSPNRNIPSFSPTFQTSFYPSLQPTTLLYPVSSDPTSSACYIQLVVLYATIFQIIPFIFNYLFYASVLVSLVGIGYGAEIAYRMTQSWIDRFGNLRRLTVEQDNKEEQQNEDNGSDYEDKKVQTKTNNNDVLSKEIIPHIERDAYEHYLFIYEFMDQAGNMWSYPVIIMLFLASLSSVQYIISLATQANSSSQIAQYVILMVLYYTVYFFYPIISIAHANGCLRRLIETFSASSPDDFSSIGGRSNWSDFINTVPPAWTIFGLWITWERIFNSIYATVTAVVTSLGITAFTGNL